jgi:hypothetical protein
MACKLTKVALRTFQGKTGALVPITVDSDSGGAFVVSAVYADKALSSPWSFTIVAGYHQLSVLIENPNAGDPTRIQEVCDSGNQTLVEFNFDPAGPTQSLVIVGI